MERMGTRGFAVINAGNSNADDHKGLSPYISVFAADPAGI